MIMKYNFDIIKSQLAQRYHKILAETDLEKIYSSDHHSGIFLPAPHESYFSGDTKVFIVGQETRGWRNKNCEAKLHQHMSIEGIVSSMDETLSFNLNKPKTSKFRQFYKYASNQLCSSSDNPDNAALWSNQFCISYKGKSTLKSPQFAAIERLSYDILQTQFEILKPDIVIFTTGSSRDKYLKQCFTYESSKVHTPRRLWEFKMGQALCFRTNHPSWGGSHKFLRDAVNKAQQRL